MAVLGDSTYITWTIFSSEFMSLSFLLLPELKSSSLHPEDQRARATPPFHSYPILAGKYFQEEHGASHSKACQWLSDALTEHCKPQQPSKKSYNSSLLPGPPCCLWAPPSLTCHSPTASCLPRPLPPHTFPYLSDIPTSGSCLGAAFLTVQSDLFTAPGSHSQCCIRSFPSNHF